MSSRLRSYRQLLRLHTLEDRIVYDLTPGEPPPPPPPPPPGPVTPPPGFPPLAVDDTGIYQIQQTSSPIDVLLNDLDGNPNTGWDYATLTVVTPPQYGTLTLDPANGVFLYTPNYLLPPGLPPGTPPPTAIQDIFTYHVSNTLGMQSNLATVDVLPVGSPKEGYIVAFPDLGVAKTNQPVTIDLLANDELRYIGRAYDYSSVKLAVNPLSGEPYTPPQHGTLAFDSLTGKVTYTPNFGYVGWDTFDYEVSTLPGGPDEPFPGEVFTSVENVYVIIQAALPRLLDDPAGGTMLVVDGTQKADTIQIVPGDRRRDVRAIVNGVASPSFKPTSKIMVFGYGGNDTITVDPRVSVKTWLIGGAGNDTLQGGGGPTLQLGNEGNDVLRGGSDRDLLIGGFSADLLRGRRGDDWLVGGPSIYDNSATELSTRFDDWLGRSWWNRRFCWTDAPTPIPEGDVFDDDAKDTLRGGWGRDVLIGTLSGEFADEQHDGPSWFGGRSWRRWC